MNKTFRKRHLRRNTHLKETKKKWEKDAEKDAFFLISFL